jgi:hypothetical protein
MSIVRVFTQTHYQPLALIDPRLNFGRPFRLVVKSAILNGTFHSVKLAGEGQFDSSRVYLVGVTSQPGDRIGSVGHVQRPEGFWVGHLQASDASSVRLKKQLLLGTIL